MMRHCAALVFGVAVALGLSTVAMAFPSRSGDCGSCHRSDRNAGEVTGFDGTIDLGIGELKYFTGLPDSAIPVSVNVTNGGGQYAVAVSDFDDAGNADLPLTQGPGSSWRSDTSLPFHFYPNSSESQNKSFTFDLAIPSGTPAGYYPFSYEIAGGDEEWHDAEAFYVQVVPEPTTLALLAAGFGAIGFAVVRRRRKNVA